MQKITTKTPGLGTIIRVSTIVVLCIAMILVGMLAVSIKRTLDHISNPPMTSGGSGLRTEGVDDAQLDALIARQGARTAAPASGPVTTQNPFAVATPAEPEPSAPTP